MLGGPSTLKSIRKLSSLKYSSRLLYSSKDRPSIESIITLTLRSIRRGILLLLVDKKVSWKMSIFMLLLRRPCKVIALKQESKRIVLFEKGYHTRSGSRTCRVLCNCPLPASIPTTKSRTHR